MKILSTSTVFLVLISLASCTMNQGVSSGTSVESDDVYYQTGEAFITDFAEVDDEIATPMIDETPAQSAEEEYYEPSSETEPSSGDTHNYYGNVYNYGNMNTGYNPNFYSGFNNGWYNPWQPSLNLVWDPWRGWNVSYGYNNYGWGNYWNDPWGWNSPCYDPWYYNSWSWNNWNTPYGYYNPYGWNNSYCSYGNYWYNGYGNYYNNYYNNDWTASNGNSITYGNRPSLTVGSAINSSYTEGQLNTGRLQHKPLITSDVVSEVDRIKDDYQQSIQQNNAGLSSPDRTPAVSPVSGYHTSVGSKPAVARPSETTAPTKPSVQTAPDRNETNTKPPRTSRPQESTIERPKANAPTPSRPSAPATRPAPSKPAPSSPAPSKTTPTSPPKRKAPGSAMLQDNEVGPSRSSGNSYTGSRGSNNTTVQSDSRPSRQPVQVERAPERKMETPKFVQENTPSIKAPERKMEAPKVAGDNASRPSKTPSPSASPKSNPTRKR